MFCIPQHVLHTISLYCGWGLACAWDVLQPVLGVCLSLYCTPSARTSDVPQPVLHTLSPYFTPSACTSDVPQPVLHTLSPYFGCASACTATPSARISHPQPVLRMCLSLYCTYFIQGEDDFIKIPWDRKVSKNLLKITIYREISLRVICDIQYFNYLPVRRHVASSTLTTY